MKELKITTVVKTYRFDELSEADRKLVTAAKEATRNSYAPYSGFSVGAAALLRNGIVVTGSNQENVAYPSGLCAERTTLFYANSQYPGQPVDALAIAAYTGEDFVDSPITPCGACRQVMLETETRYNHPIRILLYGKKDIYEISRVSDLLPLSFDKF
jgi:cytidine deaminase